MGISRGSVYYLPRPVRRRSRRSCAGSTNCTWNFPFAGSRMLRDLLAGEGFAVGRLHVATLMRRMGIEALYRRPNTSKPAPGHKIYPYLLRKLAVDRPNQVWAMDITYIPMARGFVYLAAVSTGSAAGFWHGGCRSRWRRRSASRRCEEALARYGKPEIFNTDQGSQFTSAEFTGALHRQGDRDQHGRQGRWRDNVFVERLWRTVKYEEVYLRAYDTVRRRTRLTRPDTSPSTMLFHTTPPGYVIDQNSICCSSVGPAGCLWRRRA